MSKQTTNNYFYRERHRFCLINTFYPEYIEVKMLCSEKALCSPGNSQELITDVLEEEEALVFGNRIKATGELTEHGDISVQLTVLVKNKTPSKIYKHIVDSLMSASLHCCQLCSDALRKEYNVLAQTRPY